MSSGVLRFQDRALRVMKKKPTRKGSAKNLALNIKRSTKVLEQEPR